MIFQIEQLGNCYLLRKGHCEQSIDFTMDCSILAWVGFIFFPTFNFKVIVFSRSLPYFPSNLSKKEDELSLDTKFLWLKVKQAWFSYDKGEEMTWAKARGEAFVKELGLSWPLRIKRMYINGEVRGLYRKECKR